MNKLLYYAIYSWMYCHALLPLPVLYIFSDILYFPIYHLIRYRRKIVRRNLTNAFPEKSLKEIIRIEKKFYRHFCDYWFETTKLFHISDQEMQRRMKFKHIELFNEMMKNGNSALVYLGHYGNWEWIPSISLLMNSDITAGQIYRPLRNKVFDRLFYNLRKRFGSMNIAKEDTLRAIVKMRREGKKTLIGFMSDQTPSVRNVHYWSIFMNQEAPIFTGVERIARQTGFFVFYIDITYIKRGYYEAECKLISADPQSEEENAITERYIRAMENTILRNPACWLWTHNRWKFKKEMFE